MLFLLEKEKKHYWQFKIIIKVVFYMKIDDLWRANNIEVMLTKIKMPLPFVVVSADILYV